MNGDGISRCDLYVFTTRLRVVLVAVSLQLFNTTEFIKALYDSNVIPVSIDENTILVTSSAYIHQVNKLRRFTTSVVHRG